MEHAGAAARGLVTQIEAAARPISPREGLSGIADGEIERIARSHLYQQFELVLSDFGGSDRPVDPDLVRQIEALEARVAVQAQSLEEKETELNALDEMLEQQNSERERALKAMLAYKSQADQAKNDLVRAEAALEVLPKVQELAKKILGLGFEAAGVLQAGPKPETAKKEGLNLLRDLHSLTADAESEGWL